MAASRHQAYSLGVLVLSFVTAPAAALLPTQEELARAHAWAQAKFSGTIATRPTEVGLIVRCNYGPVQRNSRDGNPLRIGETPFTHGLFCHANSRIRVCLPGPAQSFAAHVGIDTNGSWSGGTAVFSVVAAGTELCRSDVCSRGQAPRRLQADLNGASEFTIVVGDAGDNINSDQADWADAVATLMDGKEIRIGTCPCCLAAMTRQPPIRRSLFDTRGGRSVTSPAPGRSSVNLESWMTLVRGMS